MNQITRQKEHREKEIIAFSFRIECVPFWYLFSCYSVQLIGCFGWFFLASLSFHLLFAVGKDYIKYSIVQLASPTVHHEWNYCNFYSLRRHFVIASAVFCALNAIAVSCSIQYCAHRAVCSTSSIIFILFVF